ncbi:MAG TPA: hypothetical protein DEB70_11750 [Planctomycetaceae bacterium]|nr:hypothetical protein [Planctomycetaceae bacterium]
MPAIRPTRSHDVKVEDGSVFVRLRETGSGPGIIPTSYSAAETTNSNASSLQSTNEKGAVVPPADSDKNTETQSLTSQTLSEDLVRELLKQVKDPELFVNIVDLGLIYDVSFNPAPDNSKQLVSIDMTMTSPACPAGPQLIADTKRVVNTHEDVADVEVRIVMEPPWTPDRMTDDARDQLGIF